MVARTSVSPGCNLTTPRSPGRAAAMGGAAAARNKPQPVTASEPPKLPNGLETASIAQSKVTSTPSASTRRTVAGKQGPTSSQGAGKVKPDAHGFSRSLHTSKPPICDPCKQLSMNDIGRIEQKTRGQRENQEWYKWRQNRITASVAHQISHSKFANEKSDEVPQSYLKAVLGTGPKVQTTAMNWGIKNERLAVRAYEKLASKREGKTVKVEDCGLFIHPTKNWLAASPDGLVKDDHTGEILNILEVKCPYKHREQTISEACTDRNFCLRQSGDSYILRMDHAYYTQVQCQLAATQQKSADFVVHTNKETAIVPVKFDPEFWEKTESKLEKFYEDAVVPHIKKSSTGSRGASVEAVLAAEE
ncbi:uncharacterized protein WCC33_004236 [Rhinophrynus dorsalis]